MPYKDIEKRREYSKEYTERYKQTHPEWNKKEKQKQRIHKLWFGQNNKGKKSRLRRIEILTKLGGCCIIGYETEPFELVGHHPFKIENNPEFMICLCHKHHFELFHKPTAKQLKILTEGRKKRWLNNRGKTVSCANCGKEIYRRQWQLKRNKTHCCSYKCHIEYQRKQGAIHPQPKLGKYVHCANCGKEIYRHRRELKRNKNHYCSYKCHSEYRRKRGTEKI
jgi:hypothetical protein